MRDKSLFKSEADFIAWIRRRTPRRVAGLTLGIGDDAALITVPPGQEIILTTDMSIEGVHFTPTLHSPAAVGHRALARSLSDIAAMGGTPRYALISLAVSQRAKRAWLEGFFNGLFALARRFAVAVIGGDTAVVTGPVVADVVVAGVIPHGQALRRSGAKARRPHFRQWTAWHGRAWTALAHVPKPHSKLRGEGGPSRSAFPSTPMRLGSIPFRASSGHCDDGPERWPFHRSPATLRRESSWGEFVRRSNPRTSHSRY